MKRLFEKILQNIGKKRETKIASLDSFVYIPTRQDLKDKPEILNTLDLYKKRFNQILASKRIILSQDLEFEDLYKSSQMYMDLLVNLIGDDDFFTSFEKVLYYNIGTKKVDYLSKMSKLKSYFHELDQLHMKAYVRIIALQEILNEKMFLSFLKKSSIKDEINNLIGVILTIENQIRAISIEVGSYLDEYTVLHNEEFEFNDGIQAVIKEKCQELRTMISLLMPGKLEDLNVEQNSISNLVFMEKCLEEYMFNHKDDADSLKNTLLDETLGINEGFHINEITPFLKNLELKLKAFALYGHNLISESDIKNFYTIKFNFLTRDMMKNPWFNIVEDITHIETECYIEMISKKISDILTGQNVYWNEYAYNNIEAVKLFKTFLKSEKGSFEYWDILASKRLLGLVVAFDKPNGFLEYLASFRVPKKNYPQVNFHDNIYQHTINVKKRVPDFPCFVDGVEKCYRLLLEYSDVLSLETVFRMAYYNGDDIEGPLYNLFKVIYSQIEDRETTFKLPEGLISINIPTDKLNEDDARIIELLRNKATNKDFWTPQSLVEINGPLLNDVEVRDIYLNESLERVSKKAFMGLNAHSIHLPKSLIQIDDSVFDKAIISEIYFNDLKDLDLDGEFKLRFINLIKHFFSANKVGKIKVHYASKDAIEKQRLYRSGKYSAFSDLSLFDHDSVYQDYELKLKNCSRIIFKSDGVPTFIFNADDIKLIITKDLTYGKEKKKIFPILPEDASKIYYYLQNVLKDKIEEEKRVLSKIKYFSFGLLPLLLMYIILFSTLCNT